MKQVLLNLAAAFCLMISLGQQYARADNCDQALRPAAFIMVGEDPPPDIGNGQEIPDAQMQDPVWDFLIDKMWSDGCGNPGPDLNYMDQNREFLMQPPKSDLDV